MNNEQLHAAAAQNLADKRAAFQRALLEVFAAERELGVLTERRDRERAEARDQNNISESETSNEHDDDAMDLDDEPADGTAAASPSASFSATLSSASSSASEPASALLPIAAPYPTTGLLSTAGPRPVVTGNAAQPLRLVSCLAPVPFTTVITMVYAGVSPTEMTLGLPRHTYAAMEASGYENTWLQQLNLSPERLTNPDLFRSKMKLQQLVNKQALRVGDEIYFNEAISYVNGFERLARITSIGPKYSINLAMSSTDVSRPHAHGPQVANRPLNGCTGPGEILHRFGETEPRGLIGIWVPQAVNYWTQLRLRRGGVELGTLGEVRQSLHRWVAEMEVWNQDGKRG